MIYKRKPHRFENPTQVAGCSVICDGKILLLLRHREKSYGDCWGEPAGKVEPGEQPIDAAARELYEETSIRASKNDLLLQGRYYIQFSDKENFIYYGFALPMKEKPKVKIEAKGHSKYGWFTPEEALQLNLVEDEEVRIRDAQRFIGQ